jgi:hypothetical protein
MLPERPSQTVRAASSMLPTSTGSPRSSSSTLPHQKFNQPPIRPHLNPARVQSHGPHAAGGHESTRRREQALHAQPGGIAQGLLSARVCPTCP